MLRDALFPAVAGLTRRIVLTENTTFTKSMLGCLVVLGGYQLNLVGLNPADFGVVFIVGAGTTIGKKVAALGAEDALVIAVSGSDFDYPLGGGVEGGVNSIDDVPGLTAALAAKANQSDLLVYGGSAITGLTGGAGKLDGIPTVALPAGTKVGFMLTDAFGTMAYSYELVLSAFDFEDFPILVTPLDNDFITNPKVWKLRSATTKSRAILDSTAVGRALLTAEDADAARNALAVRRQTTAVLSDLVGLPDSHLVPHAGSGFSGFPSDVILLSHNEGERGEGIHFYIHYATEIAVGQPPADPTWNAETKIAAIRVRPQTYATIGLLINAINAKLMTLQASGVYLQIKVGESSTEAVPQFWPPDGGGPFGGMWDAAVGSGFGDFPEDVILNATGEVPEGLRVVLVYDGSIAVGQPPDDAEYDSGSEEVTVRLRPETYATLDGMFTAVNAALEAVQADDLFLSVDVGDSGDLGIPMFIAAEDAAYGGFNGKNGDRIILLGSDFEREFYLYGSSWYPMPIGGAAPGESQAFAGTLLGPNQSAIDETAYLTRLLWAQEALFSIGTARELLPGLSGLANTSGTGGASAAAKGAGFELSGGTAAGGWSRHGITRDITNISLLAGENATCGTSFALALHGAFDFGSTFSDSGKAAIRIVVGDPGAGAVPAPGAQAIASRGFGVELAFNGTEITIRLFAHSGSAYVSELVAGAGASSGLGGISGSKLGSFQMLLIKDEDKVKLLLVASSSNGSIYRMADPSMIEWPILTGAPVTGNYAQPWISAVTANHAANAPTVPPVLHVLSSRLLLKDGALWF